MTKSLSLSHFTFFGLLLLFQLKLHAQEIAVMEDSIPALSETISFYMEEIKDDSFIYKGREYVGFDHRITGHPFFETNKWQQGDLRYKGQFYHNVPILYDITAEEVVVNNKGVLLRVRLYKEKLAWFTLLDHDFINLSPIDAKGAPLISGFYDRRYNGNTSFFVKRKKVVEESIVGVNLQRQFVQKNFYYIQKEGVFYPVKSKRAVLKVLKDHKREIRRHLKKNDIWFKSDPEFAILKMVEFYDQAKTW